MRRNVAGQTVSAMLVSKTDGSAVTTGTTTVYVTGDAGTQATGSVGSGAATHEGNGLWSYAPAQAETNYANVCFTFVNTSAVNANIQIYTLAYDASGQVTVGALAADTITSSAVAASAVTEIQSGLSTLDAAGVRTAIGLASANLDTQLTAIDDFLDTEVAAIKAKTDNLPTDPADQSAVEAAILAAWTTALTEAYRTNGGTGTPAQLLYEIVAHLGESAIAGTTKTIKKIDHSTTAATFTLDDATTPTSITRAT